MNLGNSRNLFSLILFFVSALVVSYALITYDYRVFDVLITLFLFAVCLGFSFNKKSREGLLNIYLIAIVISFLVYKLNYSKIRVTVPEMFIIIISSFIIVGFLIRRIHIKYQKLEKISLLFCLIYVLGGLISSLHNNVGLDYWMTSCVVPFLILFISFSLISSLEQINSALFVACISMCGFLIFTLFTIVLGYGEQIPNVQALGVASVEVQMGKVKYVVWGNWIGATAAMIFPLYYGYFLIERNLKNMIFYTMGVILSIYYTYHSGSRGGMIGILLSSILLSGLIILKLPRTGTVLKRILFLSFSIILSLVLLNLSINPIVEKKILDVYSYGIGVRNISYRVELLYDAYSNLLRNPVGIGFSTLWEKYRIDEANFFSWSANGVGLLGVIGFWGVWVTMVVCFVESLMSRSNARIYSVLGLGTIVSTFIAANTSDQVLLEPQTTLCFWFIMSVLLKSYFLQSEPQFLTINRKHIIGKH